MQAFNCPSCGARVSFEAFACDACEQELLFDVRARCFRSAGHHAPCANRARNVCNWATDHESAFCRSCRLDRTVPNLGIPRNVVLWRRAEQAKRRLLYDISRLGLPLNREGVDVALSFDILSDETSAPILTGHLSGHITLSLQEADDAEREARRSLFREPYRTLLGHFRHEVGHFYWDVLINRTRLNLPFRSIFGDERLDYTSALASYHARADRSFDRDHYISEYACSHPWEDWAETFAHFLHIVATLDTAAGLPLTTDGKSGLSLEDPYREDDFDPLLAAWTPLADSLNELNRSMGMSDAYPFRLTPTIVGKLHFVHLAIQATTAGTASRSAETVRVASRIASTAALNGP